LREFLLSDFQGQDYFAYLVFESPDQIRQAEIVRSTDGADAEIQVRAPGRTLAIRPVPDEYRAAVVAVDGEFAGSTLHSFMLLDSSGERSLYLSNRTDVLYGCLAVLELLEPVVFEGRPLFVDGYLFQKAAAHLFEHFLEQHLWPRAVEFAEYSVRSARSL